MYIASVEYLEDLERSLLITEYTRGFPSNPTLIEEQKKQGTIYGKIVNNIALAKFGSEARITFAKRFLSVSRSSMTISIPITQGELEVV